MILPTKCASQLTCKARRSASFPTRSLRSLSVLSSIPVRPFLALVSSPSQVFCLSSAASEGSALPRLIQSIASFQRDRAKRAEAARK